MKRFSLAIAISGLAVTACSNLVGADFDDLRSLNEPVNGAEAGAPSRGPGKVDDAGTPTPDGSRSGSAAGEAGGGGGDVKQCRGVALACRDLDTSAACAGQAGCAWTTPKCTGMKIGCATSDPSRCSIRPGCMFDFDFRECYPTTTYCPAAGDEATCTSRSGCSWTGGCAGTPARCETQSVSDCTHQLGCVVSSK